MRNVCKALFRVRHGVKRPLDKVPTAILGSSISTDRNAPSSSSSSCHKGFELHSEEIAVPRQDQIYLNRGDLASVASAPFRGRAESESGPHTTDVMSLNLS